MKNNVKLIFYLLILVAGLPLLLQAQPDVHPPVVNIDHPGRGEFTSCRNPGVYITITDESPINWESLFLTITIDMHPYDLPESLASGPFGDLVIFPMPIPLDHGDSVMLVLAPVYDIFENGSLPVSWRFYVDRLPPTISGISPAPESVVRNLYQEISATFSDPDAGVNRDSSSVIINGVSFNLNSAATSWEGNTFTFHPELAGVRFHGGDTVHICVVAADNAKYCHANKSDSCFVFYISADGPILELISPFHGAAISCPDSAIIIAIYDIDGIDTTSIEFILNGETITISDPALSYDGEYIVYAPEPPLEQGYYHVRINVTDWLGNPPAESFEFDFLIDTDPPAFDDFVPPDGAVLTETTPLINVHVEDTLSGLYPEPFLLMLFYDGLTEHFTLDDSPYLMFDYPSSRLIFNTPASGHVFHGGDSITVCVIAYDSVDFCDANYTNNCWSFSIAATPPIPEIVTPLDAQISSCDDQSIILTITDDEGIDRETIILQVDGIEYTVESSELSFENDTLIFTPSTPWSDGVEVNIVLLSASDILGNEIEYELTWAFRVDLTGPEVTYFSPGDEGFTTDTLQMIRIRISDAVSGVDPETIELEINGVLYSYPTAGLRWDGSYLTFSPETAGNPYDVVDTIIVCLNSVFDSPDLCDPNSLEDSPFCWIFYVDAREPVYAPLDDIITACPDQETWIYLWSPLGFYPDSILMEINDVPYTLAAPELTFANDTLRFVPSVLWDDGDTVKCLLVKAVDPVHTVDSVSWRFYVDYSPPELWEVSPYPGQEMLFMDPNIIFYLHDRISGVIPSSFQLTLNGDIITWSHPAFTISDSFFEFEPALAGMHFNGGDTVSICLYAHDHADPFYCGPNFIDSCWQFHIQSGGPVIDSIYPGDDIYFACDSAHLQQVEIYIFDPNGVDPSSIILEVNGVEYTQDSAGLVFSDTILYFQPTHAWANGELVEISLTQVWDFLENPGETIDFSFIMDLEPPVMEFTNISPGYTVTSTEFQIHAQYYDSISGLDSSSVLLFLNRAPFPFTWDSAGIVSIPIFSSAYDTLEICTYANDNARGCDGNIAGLCYDFYVDAEGPFSELVSPAPNAISACLLHNIYFVLYDLNAIDPTTIALQVNEFIYGIDDFEIRYYHDTLRFVPLEPWEDGEMVAGSLFACQDIYGNPLTAISYFNFLVDLSPPFFRNLEPAPEAFIDSLTPVVSLEIHDSFSTVAESSILIEINGLLYPLVTPGIEYSDPLLTVDLAAMDIELSGGDTVNICVSAIDIVDYCSSHTGDTCWAFYIVSSPPVAEIIDPTPGSITTCEDQEILISLFDEEGIEPSSIRLSVEGRNYDITFPEIDLINDTLIFTPSTMFSDGDTVEVSLYALRDILGNPFIGPLAWEFVVDLSPPLYVEDPPANRRLNDTMAVITIALWDSITPVQFDSLMIAGTWYFDGDDGVFWESSELTFIPQLAGTGALPGTVDVCIAACDIPDYCEPNTLFECWQFFISTEPPMVSLVLPFDGAITACADQNIIFAFEDVDQIDTSSIELTVGDSIYNYPHPSLVYSNDTLYFTPPAYFRHNETIEVSLTVADTLGNIIDPPYEFSFIVDLEPPEVVSYSPAMGEIVFDAQQDIIMEINDIPAGVDPSSIMLWVNSLNYGVDDSILTWDGNYLTFFPENDMIYFQERETVTVVLTEYADLPDLCTPNYGENVEWYFIIGDDDTLCPTFDSFAPPSVFEGDSFKIHCRISDPSGIWEDSVYIIWDIDGDLENGGENKTMMMVDSTGLITPTTVDFVSRTYIPGFYIYETLVYKVFAYDNDFDYDDPADRTGCFSEVQRIYTADVIFFYGDDCPGGNLNSYYDELCRDTIYYFSAYLTNTGQVPVDIMEMYFETISFNANPEDYILEVGDTIGIEISFQASDTGEFLDTLSISYFVSKDTSNLRAAFSAEVIACDIIEEYSVVPNPFTPNNDGYNDYVLFTIPNPEGKLVEITIFNYDNKQVTKIESTDPGAPIMWTGRDDERRPMRQGPYFYIIKVGGKIKYDGVIILAR
ncbi:gliding motility-associated C-terminal domain-containing protein [bacterium]|nr:gliding motility-associated C-terminal domain-containing protein [bacterium]